MIKISNDKLTVAINEKGAELQSIIFDNIEYLWQGDAAFWAKHSPVLFPIVGELKNGRYFFEDKSYTLSRHGFARDRYFSVEQSTGISAKFILQDDDASHAVYPFKFKLEIEYIIKETSLFCNYIITNNGNDTLYFSVGGHPAFNVPLVNGLNYDDYFLKFNDEEKLQRSLLQGGLITGAIDEIHLKNKSLQLHYLLFYSDAIVLKNLKSNMIKLYSGKDSHGLNFGFSGFPYFGIWAAKDAPFVCLEPWCGIADNISHNQQFIHKVGIQTLAAGNCWQRGWSVEMF